MDKMVYANNYSLTITGSEAFFTFKTIIPTYDENGNQTGTTEKNEITIVMPTGGVDAIGNMIEKMKHEANDDK